MKKIQKRLALGRETLKHLRDVELVPVVGGNTGSCLGSCQFQCITVERSGCRICVAQ